jgi:DNA helicase TIP49 (TBP-interacting protein)
MVGSEFFSTEIKKTEVLIKNFRRAKLAFVSRKLKKFMKVIELTPVESENPMEVKDRNLVDIYVKFYYQLFVLQDMAKLSVM